MAQIAFDATQIAPAVPLTPIPDGWFPVMITESDIKPTSTGTGLRMPLTLTVCEGHPYAGRKIFDGLNIQNDNPVAQQIAQEQLSAICHATGVIQLGDTQQLHGIPLLCKVITEPARTDQTTGKTYEAKNVVKGYAKVGTQTINMTPKPVVPSVGPAASAAPAWAQGQQAAPAPAAAAPVPSMVAAAPAPAPVQAAPAQTSPAPAQAQPAAAVPSWAQGGAQPAPAAAAPAPASVLPEGSWSGGPAAAPAPTNVVPQPTAAPAADVPAWARGAQG